MLYVDQFRRGAGCCMGCSKHSSLLFHFSPSTSFLRDTPNKLKLCGHSSMTLCLWHSFIRPWEHFRGETFVLRCWVGPFPLISGLVPQLWLNVDLVMWYTIRYQQLLPLYRLVTYFKWCRGEESFLAPLWCRQWLLLVLASTLQPERHPASDGVKPSWVHGDLTTILA